MRVHRQGAQAHALLFSSLRPISCAERQPPRRQRAGSVQCSSSSIQPAQRRAGACWPAPFASSTIDCSGRLRSRPRVYGTMQKAHTAGTPNGAAQCPGIAAGEASSAGLPGAPVQRRGLARKAAVTAAYALPTPQWQRSAAGAALTVVAAAHDADIGGQPVVLAHRHNVGVCLVGTQLHVHRGGPAARQRHGAFCAACLAATNDVNEAGQVPVCGNEEWTV